MDAMFFIVLGATLVSFLLTLAFGRFVIPMLRALHAGDRVKVELFRAGAELEVTVTLDERPGEDEIEAFEAASNGWDDYGEEETDGEFFGDFG